VHQLNTALTEKADYTMHLYSAFPFPFRKDGGPRDAFEQEAMQFLAAHPDDVFRRAKPIEGCSPSGMPVLS